MLALLPSAAGGVDLRHGPGAGASGGLGAGLAAIGARLLPRFDVLLDGLDLDARLARADLVVTTEGALDRQTTRGKIPAEVERRAKAHGRPVLALAGTIGEGAQEVRGAGVDAYHGILLAPVVLAEALGRGREFLADAAEAALRMVLIGTRLTGAPGRFVPAAAPGAPAAPRPPRAAARSARRAALSPARHRPVARARRRQASVRRRAAVRHATAVLGTVAPAGAVAHQLPYSAHEPLDVLVGRPGAEADPDRVQRARAAGRLVRRPALTRLRRLAVEQGAHQRVGAEQPVPHADAVLGGERGGEV